MAKIPVISVTGDKTAEVDLPAQFAEPVRVDLIKRAALAVMSAQRQRYGADPEAGRKQGKAWPKRRRKFGGTYGKGISRVARKQLWRRGDQIGWVGARGAQTVKGLTAFAPKSEKIFEEKINKRENRKAIRSAISATGVLALVQSRHRVNGVKIVPIVLEDKFESLKKAKEVSALLKKIGLTEELERTKEKIIRSGRGKMRGRKHKRKVGPLLVVSKKCDLERAARNIAGVDIVQVRALNAALLAPGAQPARLTLWSKAALEMLGKERLFE